jgi:hypothetical protein
VNVYVRLLLSLFDHDPIFLWIKCVRACVYACLCVSMCVCVCVCLRESVGVVSVCVQKRPDNHLIPYAIIEIVACIRGKRVTFI